MLMRADAEEPSPIVRIYRELRTHHPNWYVEYGTHDEPGWIAGPELLNPSSGHFHALLTRIGERLKTGDRKIIAASFALRFGWSAGAAIAPFVLYRCIPDIGLENVSLKFSDGTFFERLSMHQARGVMHRRDGVETHPSVKIISGPEAADHESVLYNPELLSLMRNTLTDHARPVVEALYAWSGFSKRALWGQIASSWGGQFTAIFAHLKRHADGLKYARAFFDSPGYLGGMQPLFYPVYHSGLVRIYHRRASCCLYYKLPNTAYCASCPLVSQSERMRRNKEWIDKGFAP
jgi:FhuF 2Fe-2S C-terminal domain